MDRPDEQKDLLPIRPPQRPPPERALPERNGPGLTKAHANEKLKQAKWAFDNQQRNEGEAAHVQGTLFRELWVNRAELLWQEEVPAKDTMKAFVRWVASSTGIPDSTIRSHMDFAAVATADQASLGIGRCKAGHVIAHFLGLSFEELYDDRKVQPIIGRPLRFRTATAHELTLLARALAAPAPALPEDATEAAAQQARRWNRTIDALKENHPALDELGARATHWGQAAKVHHQGATTRAHFVALAAMYAKLGR